MWIVAFFFPGIYQGATGRLKPAIVVSAAIVVLLAVVFFVPTALYAALAIPIGSVIDAWRHRETRPAFEHWKPAAIGAAILVGPIMIAQTFVLEAFKIPSSSMSPTLVAGDHVFVDKLTLLWSEPERGEVVVFVTACKPSVVLVGRIVAVGGDTVEVRCGVLHLDGQPVSRVESGTTEYPDRIDMNEWTMQRCRVFRETIGGRTFDTCLRIDGDHAVQDFPRHFDPLPRCDEGSRSVGSIVRTADAATECGLRTHYVVPPGYLFVMGDNRDNSRDSRTYDAVPVDAVFGRVIGVWLTDRSAIDPR